MIHVTREGAIVTIALARSEAKNALPIAAWEARIERDPDNMELRLHYGDVLISVGHYQRAVEALEKTQASFPTAGKVYWHLAHAYWHRAMRKDDGARRRSMEKKSYLKARAAFETFLRLAPDDSRASEARYRLKLLREADFGRY